MKGMHSSRLADAIDATDPLLETHGVPRQLEVDHDPAVLLKIQPLAGSVGGQQNASTRERLQRGASLLARKAAVNDRRVRDNSVAKMPERVAILGEDNRRFPQRAQNPAQAVELRFASRGFGGSVEDV